MRFCANLPWSDLAGTRITLYDVLTYLKADWPPHLIQQWLNLTAAQMTAAMNYIAAHRESLEAEYLVVVQHAATNRHYWEARNRERLARIAQFRRSPAQKRSMPSCKLGKRPVIRNDRCAGGSQH